MTGYKVDSLQVHAGPNGFTAEASDLGLAPGSWPEAITVAGGETFTRDSDDVHGGELTGVNYLSDSGNFLLVVND